MKGIIVLVSMLAALLGEWGVVMLFAGKGIFLPLVAVVFCIACWQMRFETRLWFALAVGFITDTLHLVPFGTHMLTLLTIALVCEFLRLFFSNTDSKITYGLSAALLMLVFFGAFPSYLFMLNR